MFTNLIGYQFATTTEWPLKTVVGYQYIVGRNGVFIHDANPFFEVVAPVATFTLHGDLPPITPGIRLKQPKLPGTVLEQIIADARQAKRHGLLIEAFYAVFRFGTRISVVKPRQDASLSHVTAPGGNESNLFMRPHPRQRQRLFQQYRRQRRTRPQPLLCPRQPQPTNPQQRPPRRCPRPFPAIEDH
ncbi:MAG: hypothetical protein M9965_15860 [Anaerolineae bacterium]|nr:hypothetical protein [Anaerolineae bacterium]